MAIPRTDRWWWLLAVLAACGGDGVRPVGQHDGSMSDATVNAPTDAALEAGQDGGEGLDGLDCDIGPMDQAVEPLGAGTERSFALAVAGNQADLLFLVPGCGLAQRAARRLAFTTSEPIGTAQSSLDETECLWRRHPALLAYDDPRQDGQKVVEAFYAQRQEGRFVPMRQGIEPAGEPEHVTGEIVGPLNSRGLASTVLNGRAVLAWVGSVLEEGEEDGRAVLAQVVDFQQAPYTVWAAEHRHRPGEVAIAEMGGTQGERSAVVAWASHASGDAGGVFLRRLAPTGAPEGDLEQLVEASGSSAAAAVTGHPNGGGAVAYVVDHNDASAHVRLQRLDVEGRPTGRIQQISAQSLLARGVSIAALGQGYVLAYRLLSPVEGIDPVVQLAFTDSGGRLAGTLRLARAEAAGGPTSVRVALDGRLVVAWTDIGAEGARLKVWRGTCR